LKELKITCQVQERVDYKSIIPFQGNLKLRSDRDLEKLSRSLIKYGISFPFFIWQRKGKNYCIDGHGRLSSLSILEQNGYKIPDVPIIKISAKDEADAKKKLLYENCKYGDLTYDTVMEFVGDLNIDMVNFSLPSGRMVYTDNVDFDPGSFQIVIPKITQSSGPDIPTQDKIDTFRIGKMVLELADEEAGLLAYSLKEYLEVNNGLFGFIAALNGEEVNGREICT